MDKKTFFDQWNRPIIRPDDKPIINRPGAYALVFRKGEILFSRCAQSGFLDLPGGKIEEGETIDECIAREGEEETGYLLERTSHVPVAVLERQFYWKAGDKFFLSMLLVFPAKVKQKQNSDWIPTDPEEISETLWIKFSDIKRDEINPCYIEPIEIFLDSKGLELA